MLIVNMIEAMSPQDAGTVISLAVLYCMARIMQLGIKGK